MPPSGWNLHRANPHAASRLENYSPHAMFGDVSPEIVAATTATAAGAILAMLAGTMIPEAFETAHDFAGLVTVAGFLTAFVVSKLDR